MEIGVFAYIEDGSGSVLLVRDKMRTGLWTLPGGGLEPQELLPDAAIREVKEEASVDIKVEKLLGVFSQKKTPGIVALFKGHIVSGTPTPDGVETQECRFFNEAALRVMQEQIKPAQLSMIYQVRKNPDFPIFNHFILAGELI